MLFLVKITVATLCITTCQSTLAKQPWPQIGQHEYDQSMYSNAWHYYDSSTKSIRFPDKFYRNVPHIKPTHPPTIKTEIQYAPLHIHNEDELLSRQYYGPTPTALISSSTSTIKKQLLEPRIPMEHNYQPGYYKEHQWHLSQGRRRQVSSRSPGLNAVYRKMAQLKHSETLPKDNNIARVTRNDDPVKLDNGHTQFPGKPTAYLSPSVTMIPLSYKKYNVPPGHDIKQKRKFETVRNIYDKGIQEAKQDSLKLKRHQQEYYYHYNKYHKLHLNIARRHNPNQPTPKSQLHNRLYFQQMYNANAKKPQPLLNNKKVPSYYYSLKDRKGKTVENRGEKTRSQLGLLFPKPKY